MDPRVQNLVKKKVKKKKKSSKPALFKGQLYYKHLMVGYLPAELTQRDTNLSQRKSGHKDPE